MWLFCLRSLVREYGWRFASRVAVRHPMRTLQALHAADILDVTGGGVVQVRSGTPACARDGAPSIVGAGFCLKPVNPPCPSGRANHDCFCLEHLMDREAAGVPVACRSCTIREIGMTSLRAGSAFYVMTSARDILEDVYVPALVDRRFPTGLFVLCRYSFKPFAVGAHASGMSARLLPLESGDCRDFKTWLAADRGIKPEQTTVGPEAISRVATLLPVASSAGTVRFERRGNVLHPVAQEFAG